MFSEENGHKNVLTPGSDELAAATAAVAPPAITATPAKSPRTFPASGHVTGLRLMTRPS
jgi:hypothetical protein